MCICMVPAGINAKLIVPTAFRYTYSYFKFFLHYYIFHLIIFVATMIVLLLYLYTVPSFYLLPASSSSF